MKTLKINLQRDEAAFNNEGKVVYMVSKSNSSAPTGFSNAFDMIVEGKAAERVEAMFEVEAAIYAYPDARAKSGYRFVQY